MLDLLALSLLPAWRWRFFSGRLRTGESASRVLEDECLRRVATQGPSASAHALRRRAEAAAAVASAAGLRALAWDAADYPGALAEIVDPPPLIWLRGQTHALSRPAVAIVGSRAGSPYALSVAERLAGDLVQHGLVVVSGLARGVDAAAHRGAVEAGGTTVAVLGCGADRVYPADNRQLANRIVESGCIVSELAPGTPPIPSFFPRRNRLISGLSLGVVVVEAGQKSGSLITARCALEQGRDVMAVPGNILTERNRGGHALLKDGARLVESAADVLDELNIETEPLQSTGSSSSPDVATDPVLAALVTGEGMDVDQIVALVQLPPAQLLPRLLALELDGRVRRLAGGRFVRV